MKTKKTAFIRISLFFILFSGLVQSIPASADESVITTVKLSVPVSCSLSGTGMNSHTAEIVNGRTTNHWDIYSYNGRLNVGNIGGDYGISVRCVRSN